ncbi:MULTISPECIES: Lacal_2735 family protein [unclassified Carboxylicivirga]|uniref:Lacal_2735 family protein n=1 Tax=Carboxylicivirga TaxID=1628153 RepID=UPI003D32AA0C
MIWKIFKKSPAEKLHKEYEKLMKESYRLSRVDRKAADEKYVMAEAVMTRLQALTADK